MNEQAGSRSFTCSTPPLPLKRNGHCRPGQNVMVDHHYRASRTTETQQKGKSWSDRDI